MLAKDAPQLFARRVRDQVLEETNISERECRADAEDERCVDLETRSRLYRIRKATENNSDALADAPLDTGPGAFEIPENSENRGNGLLAPSAATAAPGAETHTGPEEASEAADTPRSRAICENELPCLSLPRSTPRRASTEGSGKGTLLPALDQRLETVVQPACAALPPGVGSCCGAGSRECWSLPAGEEGLPLTMLGPPGILTLTS